MMTSVRTGNLPLLLPWAVAILPSLGLTLRRPWPTAALCVVAAVASVLPTLILNARFSSDWSGVGVGHGGAKNALLVRAGANAFLIPIENFVPPVFPLAGNWNRDVKELLPPGLGAQLARTMEWPGSEFKVGEMQIEENAGLGFGVCVLLLASVAAAASARRKNPATAPRRSPGTGWQKAVRWASMISLLALMTQSGLSTVGRVLSPYYALLLPVFLAAAGHERLVTRRWWRATALTVFLLAAGLLVISPARPLFPVKVFLEKIQNAAAKHPLLARAETVYSVYASRNDAFTPARAVLPPDLKILGLIAFDTPETSLWRPFGSRRVEHVCPGDTPGDLERRGIEYVLVKTNDFENWFGCPPDVWVKQTNARLVQKIPLQLRAASPATDWYLVKLR